MLGAGFPAPVVGGFTTRAGGVSEPPWDTLNLGGHVGDDPDRVAANRELLAQLLGSGRVIFPPQVHGNGVLVVGGRHAGVPGTPPGDPADALVTSAPEVAVGVLVADCVPVLLADPVAGVVGAAHAGRGGLAAGVLQAAVAAMAGLGARPADLRAVIGPAVCGRCYEVPASMREEIDAVVPGTAAATRTGTPSLDLPGGAARILRQLGVGEVRASGHCTMEDDRFFSYRRDGTTGRFAGVVMLSGDD